MTRQEQAEEVDMRRLDNLQRRGFSYLEAHAKVQQIIDKPNTVLFRKSLFSWFTERP